LLRKKKHLDTTGCWAVTAADRESAAACIAELQRLPRVQKGQCRVATVGMRVDGRTHAADVLRAWARDQGVEMIGLPREADAGDLR